MKVSEVEVERRKRYKNYKQVPGFGNRNGRQLSPKIQKRKIRKQPVQIRQSQGYRWKP